MIIENEKYGAIDCNERFLSISGYTWCGLGGYMCTRGAIFYNNVEDNHKNIGGSIIKALSMSMNLEYSMETMRAIEEDGAREVLEWNEYTIKAYGYKTKTALHKNMIHCSLMQKDETIVISPTEKKGYGNYRGLDDKYDIVIKEDTPPELLGACVRFAFTRCKGKGVDVVTKALFPEGVPNSLEDYLESIDKGYKKWLIK